MERIHAELLAQLQVKGYSIDAGLAVDARLVRSASSPLSKDKLEKINQQRQQEKKDGKDKPVKFSRDVESDWTVKNDVPFYGMKEHASMCSGSSCLRFSATKMKDLRKLGRRRDSFPRRDMSSLKPRRRCIERRRRSCRE